MHDAVRKWLQMAFAKDIEFHGVAGIRNGITFFDSEIGVAHRYGPHCLRLLICIL